MCFCVAPLPIGWGATRVVPDLTSGGHAVQRLHLERPIGAHASQRAVRRSHVVMALDAGSRTREDAHHPAVAQGLDTGDVIHSTGPALRALGHVVAKAPASGDGVHPVGDRGSKFALHRVDVHVELGC